MKVSVPRTMPESTPNIELATFTLNGVRPLESIADLNGLGDWVQHHPYSRCYHDSGVEVLPDCSDKWVAYLFVFTSLRRGHCCPHSFSPFKGTVTFRGDEVNYRDREIVYGLLTENSTLFEQYESGESFFRFIHVVRQTRIGFFYSQDGELDRIMLN